MIHCTNSTSALVTLEFMESWKAFNVSKEHDGKGVPCSVPQKLSECLHHKVGFKENADIRIQGKDLLGHTVLLNNPAILHDIMLLIQV